MYIKYDENKFKNYKMCDDYKRNIRIEKYKQPMQKIWYIPISDLIEIK